MTDKQPTSDTPDMLDAIEKTLVEMYYRGLDRKGLNDYELAKARAIIRQYISDGIGPDEPKPNLADATHMTQALEVKWRNRLRQEIRKALGLS